MPICHLSVFFVEKCLFRTSHFLIVCLLLSCISSLYILEVKPLSVISFADIFSEFVGCLFILFMVSFVIENLLSLVRSHLFIFVFIYIALGDWPKKTLV